MSKLIDIVGIKISLDEYVEFAGGKYKGRLLSVGNTFAQYQKGES
jgi:hypothetical protein